MGTTVAQALRRRRTSTGEWEPADPRIANVWLQLRLGAKLRDACHLVGLRPEEVLIWMARGEKFPYTVAGWFRRETLRAEAQAKVRVVNALMESSLRASQGGDWRAPAETLKTLWRNEYGRGESASQVAVGTRVEETLPDGSARRIEHVVRIDLSPDPSILSEEVESEGEEDASA